MDNADIGYRGMVGTPFKQGNWQLPRGMRNQPYNPTATERIFSVLGRDSETPTGGTPQHLLNLHANTSFNLSAMHDFLQKHGVNTTNLTIDDLEKLYNLRLNAIKNTTEGNFNLALPSGEN